MISRYFKTTITVIFFLLTITLFSQNTGTPNQLLVKTDANNSLLASAVAQVTPISQSGVFSNTRVKTDADGNLLVGLASVDLTSTSLPSCGFGICGNYNPISTPSGTAIGGISGYANYAATAVDGSDVVFGGRFSADYSGSGGLLNLRGLSGTVQTYGSAGTVVLAEAIVGHITNWSSGAVGGGVIGNFTVQNNGGAPYGYFYGVDITGSIQSAITDIVGLHIGQIQHATGTPATSVGLIIEDWTPGAATSEYNFWSKGATSINRFDGAINLGVNKTFSATAPTISSGFGATPSIVTGGIATVFRVNIGTGGSATSGVLTMPTAANGWNCFVNNLTSAAAHVDYNTRQTASSVSSVTIENQTTSTGAAVAWAASDIVSLICAAF